MGIIRKGLQFDDAVMAEARAADVLTLAGRKQSVFITILVEKFLAENGISDVNNLTRQELDAAIINTGRLISTEVSMTRHNAKSLAPRNYTKHTTKNAVTPHNIPSAGLSGTNNNLKIEENDDVDDEMIKMLEAFE